MSNKYGSIDDFVEEQQHLKKEKNNKKNAKKRNMSRKAGIILSVIQLVLSLALMGLLLYVNMFPAKYLIFAGAVLLVLWIAAFATQFKKKINIVGKVISVITIIALIMGIRYVVVTNNMLDVITKKNQEKVLVAVAVLKDDPAQNIEDAADYQFGIQKSFGRKEVDETITALGSKLGNELDVKEYDSALDLVDGLISGDSGAVVINQTMLSTYNELYSTLINTEDAEEFSEKIRIIYTNEVVTEDNSKPADDNTSSDDIVNKSFAIYVSGNDQYGDLTTTGRSDVNIIIFVNPVTKQVLLLSTPRDYWVQIPNISGQYRDKLTHAGVYGIDASMETLEQLYDCSIDYYIKINFDSVVKIIDALGGVNVYSEQEFTSNAGLYFKQGYNYMDGATAIEFVRERKHLSGGDFARGRNQLAVIEAMIDKLTSPALLTNYTTLMASVEDTFNTSMHQDDIKSLVRMQLDDNASWNVISYAAKGTGGSDYCYTSGTVASIVYEDPNSIMTAQQLIKDLISGKTIKDPEAETETTDTDSYGSGETTAY